MKLLDLFAGRLGWSKAFLERGWEVVAVDLTLPTMDIPAGVDYRLMDVLTITPEWIKEQGFDFICASSPCEQFSVHGMKCFHPNPPYPTLGMKLFNHTREICEASGLPYIMENVRAAQAFVGNAVNHCGPFYLWGSAVPILLNQGIKKGADMGGSVAKPGVPRSTIREYRYGQGKDYCCDENGYSKKRGAAKVAEIPSELSRCVVDYAERILEIPA
jgi:hypothetical protein